MTKRMTALILVLILFLPLCGTAENDLWTCPNCGQEGNYGNFCTNCGTKRP